MALILTTIAIMFLAKGYRPKAAQTSQVSTPHQTRSPPGKRRIARAKVAEMAEATSPPLKMERQQLTAARNSTLF